MKPLRDLTAFLTRWIDDAASAALSMSGVFWGAKKSVLVEQIDGAFVVRAARDVAEAHRSGESLRFVDGRFAEAVGGRVGSRLAGADVEIVLAPRRFMFRTIELPTQASGFLEGIVRAQIDRLTPWGPALAAFGCGAPTSISGGRLGVTVAATARSSITPLVAALELFEPDSIVVSTASDPSNEKAQPRIIVFKQQANRQRRMRGIKRFLFAAPVVTGLAAVAALSAWVYVDADLEATQLEVSRQLAGRRAALHSGGGVAEEAAAALAQRRRATGADVLVLESLSRALPDDTYLTELQIEDGKLQISGVTREASSLIKLIEQTDQFEHATFFTPTTRATEGNGELFHIEAQIATPFPAVLQQ
jgi:general secretion pathway protein L